MGVNEYRFEVDGAVFASADKILTGRQIRSAASLAPASDYVLIRLGNLSARSIGLEEPIALECGDVQRFRSFENDRIYTFTINERGWEWGASSINEAELRDLAGLDEDEVFILEGSRDKPIKSGDDLKLGREGVEHLVSERLSTIKIKLNGRPRNVPAGKISYETLVEMADLTVQAGPNIYYTITYRKGPRQNPEGSMQPGEKVLVKNGMVFNVRATDKS